MTGGAMSACVPGGDLMMIRVPSSATRVTPRPGVSPRLPLTSRQMPVRAGLFLQVISAAEALAGKSRMIAATALPATDLLQGFACRFWQKQDRDHGDRDRCQQPLDGRTMATQPIIKKTFQGKRRGADTDLDG